MKTATTLFPLGISSSVCVVQKPANDVTDKRFAEVLVKLQGLEEALTKSKVGEAKDTADAETNVSDGEIAGDVDKSKPVLEETGVRCKSLFVGHTFRYGTNDRARHNILTGTSICKIHALI